MNKRALATAQFRAKQAEQIMDHSNEKLIEIIQSSFSALATANPLLALEVLEQINAQVPGIEKLATNRLDEEKEYIDLLSSKLPDFMELENDDPSDEDEEGH